MSAIRTEFLENSTVAVVHMENGENRLNIAFLTEFNKALDVVERKSSVQVLITTGTGKFYSNGLDLQWMSENQEKIGDLMQLLSQTYKRILTFPVVTVAAINGHAFAGGAMLAISHDIRVMKSERGWITMNEIFLKKPLPQWMLELVRCKIPSGPVEHFVFVFGKRFTGDEAFKERLINRVCPGDRLMSEALKIAREVLGKQSFDRNTLHRMKVAVYKKAVDLMDQPEEKSRL